MHYVYVLKSQKNGSLYIGYTHDLKRRVEEHNAGKSFSTRKQIPYDVVYYEAYKSASDAKHREGNLKKFSGAYTHLKKRAKNSLIDSK
ncbi:MAG: GIY-YIG nuclease family protein [Candidatus Moraniibacteriota bacterium]